MPCMCRALLQHADKDPVCQRTYEGSSFIVSHGTQYKTLFPEIITPHNHWGPLIDHNTGEPYPMAAVIDFCLMDPLFPGSPGDSLLFNEDDLERLKREGLHVSTYREEKLQPTMPKEDKHKCAELLLQRGGITQDQWQELWDLITPGPSSNKKSSHRGK